MLVAFILRFYRLEYLTTFGRDQGIDFLSIRDIVLNHKLTLIGIKVSIADFFQGPIFLYLLSPLFYIMNLNPLAGAYTAIIISLATLITLYYVIRKMFNTKAAILATAFFAVSPQSVMFGNTPLYQNFTPLLILLGIWFLYLTATTDKTVKKYLFMFLCGFFIGLGMELHFLVISLMIAIFVFLVLYIKSPLQLSVLYLAGLFFAAAPTIIFELRHDFLNIHLLIKYFSATKDTQYSFLSVWQERLSYFAVNDWNFLIIFPILSGILIFASKKYNFSKNFLFLNRLALITLLIILLFAVKLSAFGAHYLLPFLMTMLILIPVFLTYLKNVRFVNLVCFLFVGLNLIITLSQLNNNHGYFMPDGWSLKKIKEVSSIIAIDAASHPNFNVASLLDGDTRTYPVRYMLSLTNEPPQNYTAYPQNDYLYVLARSADQIVDSTVWEITALKPFTIETVWETGDNINLYLLARNKDITLLQGMRKKTE